MGAHTERYSSVMVEIVHAKCGQLEGEDAVYLCTNFSGGKFLHRPWRDPEIISIDKPGEFLLIEAVRK
jgi:hypothetical protein